MKRFAAILTVIALGAAGCTGKKPEEAPAAAAEEGHAHTEAKEGATFAAGKGLLISPETAKAIGLKTSEVSQQRLSRQLTARAQVYRSAHEEAPAGMQKQADKNAYASALLPKSDAVGIKPQLPIQVWLPIQSDAVLPAKVLRLDEQLESITGQVEILLEIPDPQQRLKVGDFVEAKFAFSEQGKEALAIPRTALLYSTQGTFAYVQNGDYFLRTPIVVGVETASHVEIKEGLYEGDVVADGVVEMLWLIELRATKGGGHCH